MEPIESMWRIHEVVNDCVRFADAKAGAILAAEGIMIPLLLSRMSSPSGTPPQVISAWVFGFAVTIPAIMAAWWSILCVYPRLSVGAPNSVIFFDHIARRYDAPREYADTASRVLNSDSEAETELACQIWANSKVASQKFALVRKAFWAFGCSMGFGVLALFVGLVNG